MGFIYIATVEIASFLRNYTFQTSFKAAFTYIAICNKAMICLRYIINVFLII